MKTSNECFSAKISVNTENGLLKNIFLFLNFPYGFLWGPLTPLPIFLRLSVVAVCKVKGLSR